MNVVYNTIQPMPIEWKEWVATNISKGIKQETVIQTLKKNGFNDEQISNTLKEVLNPNVSNTNNQVRRLPNKWKQWVATNMLKGVSAQSVAKVLKQQGYSHAEIVLEFEIASKNPYLQAGIEATKLVRKREWLLTTCDSLARLDPSYNQQIDVIDTPEFEVFIKEYYSKNKPVILKNGINHWKALEKWTPQYFADTLGDAEIQVQFDREKDALFERNSVKLRKMMTMAEFVEKIETGGETNDYYMTANNTQSNVTAIKSAFDDLGDFGQGYRKLTDDPTFSTFFWMGPKGIFTPLHHDLTNNMLVQIYGTKKVTLIPSMQVPWLYNDSHVFSQVNFPEVDLQSHPLMANVTPVEVIIEAGDALFIPIAWWHCVHGLEKSISISFTNFNAPNAYSASFHEIGL